MPTPCRSVRTLTLALVALIGGTFALPPGALAKGPGNRAARGVRGLASIKHFVVIYQENHSFDNLYGGWERVNGRSRADAAHTLQVDAAGKPYACLKQNDINLTSPPRPASCADSTSGSPFSSAFPNAPFPIEAYIAPSATTCPPPGAFAATGYPNGTGRPGGCTEDLVHRYYQEQYQLDHGRQDRYVTGSDAAGLAMGNYRTSSLPVYAYLHRTGHPHYAVADNFFQGAFGGSFLNHQWLISGQTPSFANAVNDGSANDLHSVVDLNGMPASSPLYRSPARAAVKDQALTAACAPAPTRGPTPPGVTCGDWAVNTIQPAVQPFLPGTAAAKKLPLLTNPNIGDRLNAASVDWAWYSGGWSNATGAVGASGWTNGRAGGPATSKSAAPCTDPNANSSAVFPNCPDANFQFHHQPFNYYANLAPGRGARQQHLRDEHEFLKVAHRSKSTCALKPVSFVKPIGEQNEHPGYASERTGGDHLVSLIKAVQGGACARDSMVIVTYDEFGGQWDHVPPPGQGTTPGPHDQWGPGTRVPALVISAAVGRRMTVDRVPHDTTSILATLEHRYKLPPLGRRDAAVRDLSSVLTARTTTGNKRPHRSRRRSG